MVHVKGFGGDAGSASSNYFGWCERKQTSRPLLRCFDSSGVKKNKHEIRNFHTLSERSEIGRLEKCFLFVSFSRKEYRRRRRQAAAKRRRGEVLRKRTIKYGKVGWKLSRYYKITKFNVVFNLKRMEEDDVDNGTLDGV